MYLHYLCLKWSMSFKMIYRKQWVIPLCWNILCHLKDGMSVVLPWVGCKEQGYVRGDSLPKLRDLKEEFPKFISECKGTPLQAQTLLWDYMKYFVVVCFIWSIKSARDSSSVCLCFPFSWCVASFNFLALTIKTLERLLCIARQMMQGINTALGTSLVCFWVKPDHKGWYF